MKISFSKKSIKKNEFYVIWNTIPYQIRKINRNFIIWDKIRLIIGTKEGRNLIWDGNYCGLE